MKKVFASDFDGTLYFYKAEIKLPPESVVKIREYQAAGNLFGLCTGRQVGGLMPFITGQFEPDFFITSTGSNILDREMKGIQRRGIAYEIADALVEEMKHDYRMTIDIDGVINVFAKMDYPGPYNVISGMADAPKGMIHEVSVHTESLEEAARISADINRRFGEYVEAFQNVVEIDIAPKGCSKGKAVDVIRKHFGDCRIYGIGDSINDLPLIEHSDISYTFPYAPQEVQERVTKVVDTIVDALEDSMRDPL